MEQYKNNAANTDQTFYNWIFIGFDYFYWIPGHCGEIYDGFIWILGCTIRGKGGFVLIIWVYEDWRLKQEWLQVTCMYPSELFTHTC